MKQLRRQISQVLIIALLATAAFAAFAGVEAEAANPVLKQGDRGGHVWDLQHRLQQLGFYQMPMDGVFGPHNREAVIRFQQRYGLAADGVVGPQTWRKLYSVTYTAQEIEMLAKLVHGEARGETFEGQVAVAAVVFNRLNSNLFPNTIQGVIFEPRAFTAIDDRQYFMTPNAESYRAVYAAIRGWDPSEGALFYFNPDTATSAWIWSRPQIKKIDKHIFAH